MRKNVLNIDEILSINYYEFFVKVLMKMVVKVVRIRKFDEIEREIFFI